MGRGTGGSRASLQLPHLLTCCPSSQAGRGRSQRQDHSSRGSSQGKRTGSPLQRTREDREPHTCIKAMEGLRGRSQERTGPSLGQERIPHWPPPSHSSVKLPLLASLPVSGSWKDPSYCWCRGPELRTPPGSHESCLAVPASSCLWLASLSLETVAGAQLGAVLSIQPQRARLPAVGPVPARVAGQAGPLCGGAGLSVPAVATAAGAGEKGRRQRVGTLAVQCSASRLFPRPLGSQRARPESQTPHLWAHCGPYVPSWQGSVQAGPLKPASQLQRPS